MKVLRIAKSFLVYLLAFAVIPVVAMGFVNMKYFEQTLIRDTGFHVSGNLTGGEVVSVIQHDGFTTTVHESVTDAALFRKDTRFVQIDWNFEGLPPKTIGEEIDYDGDGSLDFAILLDTKSNDAVLTPYKINVVSISDQVMVYEHGRSLRVILRK